MDKKHAVIVGAGPAGIAAAIQLLRYDIKPLLLEQGEVGGLLRNANWVENYPGFPDGIAGPHLVQLFGRQLENAGVSVTLESVLQVEHTGEEFFFKTNRRTLASEVAVIATGTRPKRISGMAIEGDVTDRIFYEVYPILSIEGKRVTIVGAGDAAFDYALSLSGRNEVLVLTRSEQVRCIPVLRERCKTREHVRICSGVSVQKIKAGQHNAVLVCIRNDGGEEAEVVADYVVFAGGRAPCLGFLGDALMRNRDTLIKTKRLYLVGDVKNGLYRQTGICVGDGIRAAMEIFRNVGREKT